MNPRVVNLDNALQLTTACAQHILKRCEREGFLSSYTPLGERSDPPEGYLEIDRIGFPDDKETDLIDRVKEVVLEAYGEYNKPDPS